MINLTLNKLKRPALLNLVPKFGTVVEKNDINKGGLSTAEVDLNMTLPFELMRETEVSSSDTTTPIHYDARIAIVGSDPVTLTLDHATYKGCTITITNRNTEQATIVLSEDNEKHLESKQSLVLKWDGTAWIDTALVVDSTVSEESNNPVTSAAVHQKATEITEAYTQAIAAETDSRGEAIAEEQRLREEAITATEQKIEEETTARTEADTALGTRIDEEVAARTEADTKLTQQIEAIEQLHNALVSNAEGFVDSDGDTVTVEDSGKTIRQIAHEEFYRQLITDAADVQTQIDTLKELADYLQTNPSVIADMYSKLGITWSVDNLTDFGTFDFSGVLTATNVDDAILELYNTFTEKFGELTSLETSAKDNIVAAINELNTKIGEEVTAREEADTELGNRIDTEVTARTEADTELDNKITQLGTNVGQLDSLTTEEKTSTVAAINELHNLIETSTDTLTVVCEIDDTAERTAGPSGIVYTQGKIEDIDTLSQQVADNKPVQLILKSKNYMPYGFIALTSYILRPSGILNLSGYIDETQIEDEETSPVRSANKTCIHVNVDTRTGNVSIEDVDIKDVFINVAFEGEIGTEDVTITKTLSAYDIRLINNLKTGKNASTSAKFSFGGIEVTTSNYDVSDDKILFTGEANVGDRLVSYKVIISSEITDNCRLEIGKSATEQLSEVASEVNTLKESVSELGTEVEALKSGVPSEPVDAYTKTEVDGKFDNVYTKTEVDDKFSEVGGGGNTAANQEENNDFLVKKMLLNMGKEIQPVVKAKYKNNTSITKGEYIETRFVEDFSEMFSGCSKLTTVPEYDTTNATTMASMFAYCSSLTSVPELNTSKVTNMKNTFRNCSSLTSIPDMDTSKVTNMETLFYDCTSLTSIPELNTSSVTNMISMFTYCSSLTSIPNLDTSKVTDMESMFFICSSLTSIPDMDTSSVTNMMGMFEGCTSLTTFTDNPYAPEGSRWQFNKDVDFSSCPLDRTSILKVFNGLQTVTGQTIKISSTTNGYLSEEDKAIATAKGWTIQVV